MNTWIVCASQSGFNLYLNHDFRLGLSLIDSRPHPEGRLKEHDLVSDHPGTKGSSLGAGPAIHRTNSEDSAKQRLAEKFAKVIAETLNKGLDEQRFDALIVCADPHFLGLINSKLSKRSEKKIIGRLSENLYHCDTKLIFKKVKSFMSDRVRKPGEVA